MPQMGSSPFEALLSKCVIRTDCSKGKCRLRVHPKSVKKMKDKLRALTNKNTGWGNDYRRQKLAEYERGWINYFSMVDMKGLMVETDEWI
ncbi:MAG: group II intron maturase-specific domain-containing protein [Anaerocolumna sp.]